MRSVPCRVMIVSWTTISRSVPGKVIPPTEEYSPSVFRSEEHTSELQSLMRISYAVFCLKKKKKNTNKISQSLQKTYHNIQQRNNNTQNHHYIHEYYTVQ